MPRQRIQHALTGYHRKRNVMLCSCGWKCRMVRKVEWTTRLRSVVCLARGHRWEEPREIHAGPVGFDESADTFVARLQQCEWCYGHRDAA